jgi:hypothetical protein
MAKMTIEKIRIDGGTQMREEISEEAVETYAEVYADQKKAKKMPPLQVVQEGKNYWLWDGFHRYHAARRAGLESIDVVIIKGTIKDAIKFAAGANITHGLHRTRKDKRYAVEAVLVNHPDMSDHQTADWCGVSQPFVSKIHEELLANSTVKEPEKRTGRDGKGYKKSKATETTVVQVIMLSPA